MGGKDGLPENFVAHDPHRVHSTTESNAYAERFVLSIKSECLHRMICFGESSLRRAIQTYMDHYHSERPHQGIGNEVIQREERVTGDVVCCREWLGGLPQALLPGGVTMEILSRSAVIVKPRRPYLEWARRDDEEGLAESVFEGLRSEPTVYLVPEYEDPSSQQEVLGEFWPVLFEACWRDGDGRVALAEESDFRDVPGVVRGPDELNRSRSPSGRDA